MIHLLVYISMLVLYDILMIQLCDHSIMVHPNSFWKSSFVERPKATICYKYKSMIYLYYFYLIYLKFGSFIRSAFSSSNIEEIHFSKSLKKLEDEGFMKILDDILAVCEDSVCLLVENRIHIEILWKWGTIFLAWVYFIC